MFICLCVNIQRCLQCIYLGQLSVLDRIVPCLPTWICLSRSSRQSRTLQTAHSGIVRRTFIHDLNNTVYHQTKYILPEQKRWNWIWSYNMYNWLVIGNIVTSKVVFAELFTYKAILSCSTTTPELFTYKAILSCSTTSPELFTFTAYASCSKTAPELFTYKANASCSTTAPELFTYKVILSCSTTAP